MGKGGEGISCSDLRAICGPGMCRGVANKTQNEVWALWTGKLLLIIVKHPAELSKCDSSEVAQHVFQMKCNIKKECDACEVVRSLHRFYLYIFYATGGR